MPAPANPRRGHRFPAEVTARAVRRYLRFALSFGDVEGLLAERGIAVSYEGAAAGAAGGRGGGGCRRETGVVADEP